MSRIEDKIVEKIVSKIDIEVLTDKIAEKVAEKILQRDLGILDPIPSVPTPPPFNPKPYDPWKDNIVVMYGTNSTPYDTTVLTKASQIFYKPKEENKK